MARRKPLQSIESLIERAAAASVRDQSTIAPQCLPTPEQIEALAREERLRLRHADPEQYSRRFGGHPQDKDDPEFFLNYRLEFELEGEE